MWLFIAMWFKFTHLVGKIVPLIFFKLLRLLTTKINEALKDTPFPIYGNKRFQVNTGLTLACWTIWYFLKSNCTRLRPAKYMLRAASAIVMA